MQEVWKDIKGYEGIYQVSNLGRIKSLEHTVRSNKCGGVRTIAEAILHPTDNGHGYKIIGLRNKGHRKNYYIHRLVATAFIPNPKQLEYINHIDYDRENNSVDNLEWCTQKDNVNYSKERMSKPRKVTYSNTGHKYIYLRNGKFRVCVPKKSEKGFNTLEEALTYKGAIMNER